MNRVDFTFDEYQANVLRTANQKLDWSQTVENSLLGLIGELGEIIEAFSPNENILFEQLIAFGKIAEIVKKHKYHGKLINAADYPSEVYESLMMLVNEECSFNIQETVNLKKEMGDLLYYHTWLVDTLGYDASEVAQANVEKLRKRYADGFSIEASLNRKD